MKVKIYQGDITRAATDAIVNAANNHLWMGAGVAGAIKRRGGQIIEDEAVALGPIEVGEAVATTAGDLPHTYVIHAAGMGQDLKTSENLVYLSTLNSLRLAENLGLSSLAFPAIGAGVGGLSITACAQAMKKALEEFTTEAQLIQEVHFVLFTTRDLEEFDKVFE
ncbi:MAG: macro domain-containing protein [candidate division Zixibacteria bacterium]|nr:macro domain-containing protein [candidate division Zixibacteria bacterium]